MFRQTSQRIGFVVLAAVAAMGAGSLQAPRNTGGAHGVVKNSSGSPVAGAFAKVKNGDRRLTFMAISQAQGKYSVNNLPTGKYVVQGIGGEFQSQPSPPIDVAAGRSATADVALTVQRALQLPNA